MPVRKSGGGYKVCSENTCVNPVLARGLCNMHYKRLWRRDFEYRPRLRDESQWTPENIAWVAGLLEGEACFYNKSVGRRSLRIQVNMTDEDVVRRLHSILRVGTVRGPYRTGQEKHKPVWAWEVGKNSDVRAVCMAVRPYMGQRRTQRINEMLASTQPERWIANAS